MKTIELKAEHREGTGKKIAKGMRREGKIPAILYGKKIKPVSLAVNEKEFHKATHTKAGSNALISLLVEGAKAGKDNTCLIKEVQRHPVTDQVLHVDFAAVSLTEKIKVKVHLAVRDMEEAAGIKEGGVLDVVHHEVEVECLPVDIPEKIEFSVKQMKIGDAVHVKELTFPKGVTPVLDADEVVIALHPPQKEEEPAEAAAEGAAEPEVIEKGKKEKEEGAEAAPASVAKAPAPAKPEAKKPA